MSLIKFNVEFHVDVWAEDEREAEEKARVAIEEQHFITDDFGDVTQVVVTEDLYQDDPPWEE